MWGCIHKQYLNKVILDLSKGKFPFGRDNLKHILVRPFKFGVGVYGQCHERYCFVTLAFNFKVTGGLLNSDFGHFFTFWPSSHTQKVRSSYGWYI